MTTASHWEWRTFAPGLEEVAARLRDQAESVQTTRETVVVCDMSAGAGRIQDDFLEVLVPQRVVDGIELWKGALRAPFPIDALSAARMFGYLELRPSPSERDRYTVDQFLAEVVAPHHALTAVEVGRVRHVSTVNGCTCEVSELTINGVPARMLAVTGDDPARVLETLGQLGLAPGPSVSLVAAIKQRLAAT